MRFRTILAAGILLDLAVTTAAALAGTVVVSSDACPVSAEAPAYVQEPEIAAPELETRLRVAESVVILYDARLDGHEGDGLFGRLTLNFRTGLPFGDEIGEGCDAQTVAPQ
ncbi:MAG: hypothetical protein WD076_07810 [Parvularculaceae bacterium]